MSRNQLHPRTMDWNKGRRKRPQERNREDGAEEGGFKILRKTLWFF